MPNHNNSPPPPPPQSANRPEMEPHRAYNEIVTDLTQWLLALLGTKSLFNEKQASFMLLGSIPFTIYIIFLWIARNPRSKYVDPLIKLVVPILNCVVCGLIVDLILDSPVFKWTVISIYILVTVVTVLDHNNVLGGFMKKLGIVCRIDCSMFGKLCRWYGGLGNLGNGPNSQQTHSGGSSNNDLAITVVSD